MEKQQLFHEQPIGSSIKYQGRRFYNLPVPLGIEEYRKTKEKVVGILSDCPEVLSLYEFGSHVSDPGISDIDIQIVVRDDTNGINFPSLSDFDQQAQYILKHEFPHPMPASIFKKIRYLLIPHSCEGLQIVDGEEIDLDVSLTEEEDESVRLFFLFRTLVHEVLPALNYFAREEIDLRAGISMLSSMRYALSTVKFEQNDFNAAKSHYYDGVNALRANWFVIPVEQSISQFIECVREYRQLVPLLFNQFYRRTKSYVSIKGSGNAVYDFHDTFKVVFHPDLNGFHLSKTLKKIPLLGKKCIYPTIDLPAECLAYLTCFRPYAKRARFSRLINQNMRKSGSLHIDSTLNLDLVVRTLNEYYAWQILHLSSDYSLLGYPCSRKILLKHNIRKIIFREAQTNASESLKVYPSTFQTSQCPCETKPSSKLTV